jgi:hypothetical protein
MTDLNRLQWSRRPGQSHYEAWFITLVDSKTGCGFWFRYTLFVPKGSAEAYASLWAFSFDPTDSRVGVQGRDDYPLSAFSVADKGFRLELGPGSFDGKLAKGQVETADGVISWDLQLGAAALSWQHFHPALFKIGVSQSCVNSPNLSVPISGTIQVGDRSFVLDNAPGEQSHVWGLRPNTYYAWAHCNAFEDDADCVFEGVNSRIQKGSFFLPAAGPLLLSHGAGQFEVRSLLPMFAVDSSQGYGTWTFEAEAGSELLRAQVSVDPENVVAVEYDDPAGDRRVVCHNSVIADMELTLYRRSGALWKPFLTRVSKATTAFEITRVERDMRVKRVLRLADGRKLY